MSEHLPECPCANRRDEFHEHDVATMMNGQLGCLACGVDCICPALRACTVRVLGEARGVFQSERDLLHSAGYRKEFTTEEWEAVDCWLSAVVVAIDRLAQKAP